MTYMVEKQEDKLLEVKMNHIVVDWLERTKKFKRRSSREEIQERIILGQKSDKYGNTSHGRRSRVGVEHRALTAKENG